MDKAYAVERVEGNIVILENIKSGETKKVDKKELPAVKEGNIVVYDGKEYKLDKKLEESRKAELKEKMERLKALKK